MIPYRDSMLAHLAEYKRTQLGATADGVWPHDGKPCAYALPESQKELNILPQVRAEFLSYVGAGGIQLQRNFHHLDSTQALAFNLFLPFRQADADSRIAMSKGLSIPGVVFSDVRFETALDGDERLMVGVLLETEEASAVIDVRLTDSYGNARAVKTSKHKYGALYQERLRDTVSSSALTDAIFWDHYQLLRAISPASPAKNRFAILLHPKGNSDLTRFVVRFLTAFVEDAARPWIKIVYLEDFLDAMDGLPPDLFDHFREVRTKYVIAESPRSE